MSTDHNKKLPVDPWSSDTIQPKYGWIYGEADNLGGHSFQYRNINEPDKSSSQTLTPTGSYETVEADSSRKEIKSVLNPGEVRQYTGGGASMHAEGSVDQSSDSTMRTTVVGDAGVQIGKNLYQAAGENVLQGSKNTFKYTVGSSESKDYETSRGDIVKEHTGSEHKSISGDYVNAVKGNKIDIVQTGDLATRVQAGSMDTEIAQKLRYKSGNDILIESDTKITFKVGGNMFVLTATGTSFIGTGDINITTTGKITTLGSQTDIQGGGLVAPPTTFK